MVRRLALVAVLVSLAPAGARADYVAEVPQAPTPPTDEFWREVVAPHGDEIQQIVDKARQGLAFLPTCLQQDCDPTGEQRSKLLDDMYGMLRYARKLDPTQTDVLMLLGQVAEESGRASAAIEALQAYQSLVGDEKVPADVEYRLGRAYLRLGRAEDAIRHFRAGVGEGVTSYYGGPGVSSLVYLGMTLANTGRIADAIDVLSPAANVQNVWAQEMHQLLMTLAVTYDRDEQISAAFRILESLQNNLQQGFQQYVQGSLAAMVYVPAHEQHYYLGLLYESVGNLSEARTEWLIYAQSDSPFRARALDHVRAIDKIQADKLRDAAKAAKAAAKKKPAPPGKPPAPPRPVP
jgi:tetratricopeptide (TPR) repeat protein